LLNSHDVRVRKVSTAVLRDLLLGLIPDCVLGRFLFRVHRLREGWSPRAVEYAWVLDALRRIKPGKRILDVGCTGSYFPYELTSLGYAVEGLDICPYHVKKPSFPFHVCDIAQTPFPDCYFDAVVAVSTLEHVGLGAYGDPAYIDGDRVAFNELKRILAKGGHLLVTVPYGREYHVTWERIYDWKTLMSVLPHGLSLVETSFFACKSPFSVPNRFSSVGGGKWKTVTKKEVEERTNEPDQWALACLLLRKNVS
jgi:SAM-dependent methyltransferase